MDDRRADEERPAEATHSLGECLSRVRNAGPSRGASSMGPPSTRTRSIVLAETDCVAEDAVRSETVSRAALPAICDLQGEFQKLQG